MVSSESPNETGASEYSEFALASGHATCQEPRELNSPSNINSQSRAASPGSETDAHQTDVATPSSYASSASVAPRSSISDRSQSSQLVKSDPCWSSSLGRAGSTEADVKSSSRGSIPANNRAAESRLDDVFTGRREESLTQLEEREDDPIQWLQALELQVVGACRADLRLRPLLRWNVSCFGSDGRLLAHLGQHFKARELALLARCLCAPLVSIRVGEVSRLGQYLNPTTTRGYLSLTMLPCSEMRLTFVNDAGIMERIIMMTPGENGAVSLEKLREDTSGRTFAVKMPGGRMSFFWQSEKSKDTGDEMVCKMKDLLRRRPTLAQLTGIHESRLDSFASYLRSALLASPASSPQSSPSVQTQPPNTSNFSLTDMLNPSSHTSSLLSSRLFTRFTTFKALSSQFTGTQHSTHGDTSWALGTCTSGFVESCTTAGPVISTQLLGSSREKQWCSMNHSSFSGAPSLTSPLSLSSSSQLGIPNGGRLSASWSTRTSLCEQETEILSHSAGLFTSSQLDTHSKRHERLASNLETTVTRGLFNLPTTSLSENLFRFPSFISEPVPSSCLPPVQAHVPISTSSIFSPYYCPCPLGTAALQYSNAPPFLPTIVGDMSLVPPLAPCWGARPPPACFPPSLPGLHEGSYSPALLSSSPLVTAPLPLESSGLPAFFADAVAHMPILNLHLPNTSFMVHAPSSPAFCTSSLVSPVLPECSKEMINQEEFSALNFLTNPRSGVTSSWKALVSAAFGQISTCSVTTEPHLSRNRSTGVISTVSEVGEMAGAHFFERLKDLRVSYDISAQSSNLQCGSYGSEGGEPRLDNVLHLNLPAPSGPLLGMVPAVVTPSNNPQVLSFCSDLVSNGPNWGPGGLDLYNNAHDLGGSLIPAGTNYATRGAFPTQVISCDPAHKVLHLEPKSMSETSSVFCDRRDNDDKRPK